MLALLGGVVYGLQTGRRSHLRRGRRSPATPVTVRIPEGSNSDEIAHILEDAGIVDSATKFEGRLVLAGDGDDFKPGTYKLRTNEDYDIIVRDAQHGPPAAPVEKLVIPEGFSTRDVAARVGKFGSDLQGVPRRAQGRRTRRRASWRRARRRRSSRASSSPRSTRCSRR